MKEPLDATSPRAQEHLFVVRVWREQAEDLEGLWRGSATHVGSGRKSYFANLATLAEFIMLRLNAGAQEDA